MTFQLLVPQTLVKRLNSTRSEFHGVFKDVSHRTIVLGLREKWSFQKVFLLGQVFMSFKISKYLYHI